MADFYNYFEFIHNNFAYIVSASYCKYYIAFLQVIGYIFWFCDQNEKPFFEYRVILEKKPGQGEVMNGQGQHAKVILKTTIFTYFFHI